MPTDLQSRLDQAVAALRAALGENLYSCCVYGSAVRGNLIEGLSDINLLILLEDSTPAAHRAIASAIGGDRQIDPFVLARRGFARSVRAFATKFASIRRNYRVLHGADPLAGVQADPPLERFLCEQAVRNLRLRLVYAFVTRQVNKAYDRFLVRSVTPLFTQFGEVLRLHGLAVPKDFQERIGTLEKQLGLDAAVLRDLLALKAKPEKFSDAQAVNWHERVFPQVDKVLVWIETHWPAQQV